MRFSLKIMTPLFLGLFGACVFAGAQTAPPAATGRAADIEKFDRDAAALKPVARSLDIATEVIGLDIKKGSAAETELNKVAAAGKGGYYSVEDVKDLGKVFNRVTTGATPPLAGGGGGGPVLPAAGLSPAVIAAIVLLGAAFILVLAIVIVRRRGASPAEPVVGGTGSRIRAGLDVAYADGGIKPFRITSARTTIGRGPDNLLVLRDTQISTHHAEILASPDGFLLRDLGSANGTMVNGQPVTEAYLRIGDDIGIGTSHLTFTE